MSETKNGNGIEENRFSMYDRAFDKGLEQGRRYGAEDERNADPWHCQDVRPRSGEMIYYVYVPYDRKSDRAMKRNGVGWMQSVGLYLDGDTIREAVCADDYSFEEYEDAVYPVQRRMIFYRPIPWSAIKLWKSAEVPDWFMEAYKKEG